MFFSASNVLVTALAAGFVVWQIHDAKKALYLQNEYTLHKDLNEAMEQILRAEDQNIPQEGLQRLAIHFDNVIETAQGIKDRDGIENATWADILRSMCPTLDRHTYRFAAIDMPAVKDACMRGWRVWWRN